MIDDRLFALAGFLTWSRRAIRGLFLRGMSLDPQFVFAERRLGLVAPVVLPLTNCRTRSAASAWFKDLAVIGCFKAVEEDRHRLFPRGNLEISNRKTPGSLPQEGNHERTLSGRGRDSWPSFRQVRRGLADVPSRGNPKVSARKSPRLAAPGRDSGGGQVGGFHGEAGGWRFLSTGLGAVSCVQPNNLRTSGLGVSGFGGLEIRTVRRVATPAGSRHGLNPIAFRRRGETFVALVAFGVPGREQSKSRCGSPKKPKKSHDHKKPQILP